METVIPRRWAALFGPGAVYFERHVFLFFFLGFAAGIPLALSFGTLSYWLTEVGMSKGEIGLFAMLGMPYALKFAWAPLMDGLRFPALCHLFGRRRGWILATQLALIAAILAAGFSNPQPGFLVPVALATFCIAFFSASQDIVIDAYRVEILTDDQQGAGAGAYQIGYRLAMLASGTGALFLADAFGWEAAYITMAVAMLVGILTTLLSPEPGAAVVPNEKFHDAMAKFEDMVIGPFRSFFTTENWLLVLAFVALYKFGDAFASVMTGPFYLDIGFTLSEIASVAKLVGIWATIAGAVVGGMLVHRRGIIQSLWICGILQLVSNFMFVVLAEVGNDLTVLSITVLFENLAGGMGSAAFIAYMASLCNISYTATQYALLSSLANLGRTAFSAQAGFVADEVAWSFFFALSVLAAIPGLVLLWILGRRQVGNAVA
jgi:PAT family beta-lactamase induction signal transducer AmpG